MNDYLPETSPSTVALDVMNEEFDVAIPNARVMIKVEDKKEALDYKENIVETVSNVTVSILTSGLTLTVVGFLLGIISTHGLLSQLGYFLGRGTICSMIAVLFVLPCFLYVTDGICIERKKRKQGK